MLNELGMNIVSWFKVQQKIGAQLMPEQEFQIIVLGLKPCYSFSNLQGFCISRSLVLIFDLHKVKVVFQGCNKFFH